MKAICGCEISHVAHCNGETTTIEWCPLHESAPKLLAALKDAMQCIDNIPLGARLKLDLISMYWANKAYEAIAEAEKKQ